MKACSFILGRLGNEGIGEKFSMGKKSFCLPEYHLFYPFSNPSSRIIKEKSNKIRLMCNLPIVLLNTIQLAIIYLYIYTYLYNNINIGIPV